MPCGYGVKRASERGDKNRKVTPVYATARSDAGEPECVTAAQMRSKCMYQCFGLYSKP